MPGCPEDGIEFNFLLLKPKREVCVRRVWRSLQWY